MSGAGEHAGGGLVVAVPNLSEGRDPGRIRALAAAVGGTLLDRHSDPSHHRTVLTLAGRPGEVEDAAFDLFRAARRLLDLRRHRGEHPRLGALDVLPFVPFPGTPTKRVSERESERALDPALESAAESARRVGARIANDRIAKGRIATGRIAKGRLAHTDAPGIPVFLYGRASPTGRSLPDLRRGGLPGLAARLAAGEIVPDFGPARLHPTAGAVAVGARGPLLAFNVNLESDRVETARRIAAKIRESGGGLPALRALGVRLGDHPGDPDGAGPRAQVSLNLLDFRRTSLRQAFAAVRREAEALGVGIAGSEIVGLPPAAALWPGIERDLLLPRPPRSLETALRERRASG